MVLDKFWLLYTVKIYTDGANSETLIDMLRSLSCIDFIKRPERSDITILCIKSVAKISIKLCCE